ncbi:polyprenyl synthetase family protein [Glycomyces terrestris]|uniref:Polyprenyl synthetase family protein n=1 Tax=Glycomyces terrestris TaxID=2493553 RepID=A0A426UTN4_9ACTN|nr:polyprenyl synthetase family protein [Glycomyces terrestris]RRR97332.1 polyprenyl synthetase family protein [Glycomyces terrestris]
MTVLTDQFTEELISIDLHLRKAVYGLRNPAASIAAYHFGWEDADGELTEANSGKALRPLLTLLAAKTVAEEWRAALPAAVAVELVHNFSLVHDDVIDRDEFRRHRPTVWKVFGANDAILVGDALHALAFETIAEADDAHAAAAARLLSRTVRTLIEGQFADIRFEGRTSIDLAECIAMSENKTASLMGCATALGALYGGGSQAHVDALWDFGFRLGTAFQHIDDLLGIWGDPEATGKSVYSDLRSRKKSLPVTAALRSGDPRAEELARLYHSDAPLDDAALDRAAELVEACGGRRYCRESAEALVEEAVASLRVRGLDAAAVADLGELAASTVSRVR